LSEKREIAISAQLLRKIVQAAGDGALLVGGQALALWAEHYGLNPATSRIKGAVTLDADFLGDRKLVEDIAGGFASAQRKYAPSVGLTSLVGSVEIGLSVDEFVNVDVIHHVYGLDAQAVRKNAYALRYQGVDVLLMHPLDVLHSRVENLAGLKDKQDPAENSVPQTHLAVCVARRYIEDIASVPASAPAALRAVEKVASIAKSSAGKRVSRAHAVRFIEAIPEAAIQNENFRTIRWPRLRDELAEAAGLKPVAGSAEEPDSGP
jgi:hypothetical protein